MYASQSSGPGFGTGLAVGGGAGIVASQAASGARKYMSRTNIALGVALSMGATQVIGGNNNNTQAVAAANLTNTINGRLFTAGGATGPEVGLLKSDLATLSNIVSQIGSNTDPLTTAGLRNPPTLPAPSSASTSSTVPAATATTPSTGIGNLGYLILGAAVVYLVIKD